jgi:Xaa-Pro aminopeptidase
MFDLQGIQSALVELEFDGWLLYDFRGSNVLARRVLNLRDDAIGSRRCLYAIPRSGPPRKLVHRIESEALDHLPGEKTVYLTWQEFESGVAHLIENMSLVAMEYSARNANPYISRVDAGLVELVREQGAVIAESGDLIQLFEATWDDDQWQLHRRAESVTTSAFDVAWSFIAAKIRAEGSVDETLVQSKILEHFRDHGVVTHHPPIVAVGPHSGDPHYETGTGTSTRIQEGDFVLIDLWCKCDEARGVYSDLTRTGFVGDPIPDEIDRIFQIVAASRDAAITCVERAFADRRPLQGWEVDDAARRVIEEAGYGAQYVHRTGHSIGQETHGNGANMDNLETHEQRRVMRRTCFSIEPGIYLPEFGVRSEVNVFVDASGKVHVTGGPCQTEVVPILKAF